MLKFKKKTLSFLIGILVMSSPMSVLAANEEIKPTRIILKESVSIESTAYTWTGNPMKNEEYPYEGVCAAKEEWLGYICELFEKMPDGTLKSLGKYEIKDTGGHEKIKNGTCIDVYMNNKQDCIEYGRKNVIAYIYEEKKEGA